jgi:hypothetical protein
MGPHKIRVGQMVELARPLSRNGIGRNLYRHTRRRHAYYKVEVIAKTGAIVAIPAGAG